MWHGKSTKSMHHTDKDLQQSSVILPVSLIGWVFIYELNKKFLEFQVNTVYNHIKCVCDLVITHSQYTVLIGTRNTAHSSELN